MRPTGLHLLLVSTSEEWTHAVETAAASIGAGAVEATGSGREALARLVNTPRPYSHVLVQPSCSDGLIEDLHGLTSGEVGSDTRLLLLGAPATPAPRIQVIARASPQSVGAALAGGVVEWPNGPPGMPTQDLRDALAGSMIETRYQPVVRMSDGACVGLEALARLRHPAHGMLAPTHFVPQVENAGLAGQLTDAVARHALAELSRPALEGRDLTIALNFPLDVVLVPETMA
ncbi:MAG TPA: EAL domain-containing protein, partial [Acetobacteraceae bacterium]|nr:EAL domain-containing protein [Acetobacteraceae bacterium]